MNQEWFEMSDIRRRKMKSTVWIPLRASQKLISEGEYGYPGYKEEFFGAGSIAIPIEHKDAARQLDWADIGIGHHHSGYVQDGKYYPVDKYQNFGNELTGIHLVLEQRGNRIEHTQWQLNQDFAITLRLKREGDIWTSIDEGYIEVARLHRDKHGDPSLLEVRAEHLKDYLCARGMGLRVTSYFSRNAIVESASFVTWEGGEHRVSTDTDRWEGRVIEIHEGGHPYGEKIAVIHASRTDVDGVEDIPDISAIPTSENTNYRFGEKRIEGRKLYCLRGELWRNEWLDPAKSSPRIRGHKQAATVFFIVDEEGNRESRDTLAGGGKWLWFKPGVIMALAHRRGGDLAWYTKDTGAVRCSPDYEVHFGVNELGLVNVYAKDIVLLPEWQQRIWSGYNITPDGGVSTELLASQVRAEPVNTQAPEEFLYTGIMTVNALSQNNLGVTLFRDHEAIPELITRIHRFRAVDDAGLFALAKDLARVTADSLDATAMQSIVPPPEKTRWGSLKSLENLLASKIEPEIARRITSALVGVYELRHADAHLPSREIEKAFGLLDIDRSRPLIHQAHQMLDSCVSSIWSVAEVIRQWNNEAGIE